MSAMLIAGGDVMINTYDEILKLLEQLSEYDLRIILHLLRGFTNS